MADPPTEDELIEIRNAERQLAALSLDIVERYPAMKRYPAAWAAAHLMQVDTIALSCERAGTPISPNGIGVWRKLFLNLAAARRKACGCPLCVEGVDHPPK